MIKWEFHSFGKWTKVDNTIHRMTCAVCGGTVHGEHTWNGARAFPCAFFHIPEGNPGCFTVVFAPKA